MDDLSKKILKIIEEDSVQKQEISRKEFDEFREKYWKSPKKELGTIIIGHAYIESCMNKLLDKALQDSSKIQKYRFSYKTDLLEALGIITPKMVKILRTLNTIRNKVAHDFEYSIPESVAKALSTEAGDLALWKKDSNGFITYQVSYIAGYLHAVTNGQRKIRSISFPTNLSKLLKDIDD